MEGFQKTGVFHLMCRGGGGVQAGTGLVRRAVVEKEVGRWTGRVGHGLSDSKANGGFLLVNTYIQCPIWLIWLSFEGSPELRIAQREIGLGLFYTASHRRRWRTGGMGISRRKH